jgi:hypothetical protein
MDKLTVISCLLFFTADAFAIVALSMPDWIVTSVGGNEDILYFTDEMYAEKSFINEA